MQRRAILIRGIVQGVGFRPFVYSVATRLNLGGFVRNDDGALLIEAEGDAELLDRLLLEVTTCPPPLAIIEAVTCERTELRGEGAFRIETSHSDEGKKQTSVFVSPDVATCDECLQELLDPADRRYRYPFINCTNCGPRLTIVTGAPYDRQRTTMASFAMCAACQAEYDDPASRRFHAQPTCCADCGPSQELQNGSGQIIHNTDALFKAMVDALLGGQIIAIKGIGGFHLACSAMDESVVQLLRARKHRDEKPFAVMVKDVAAARRFCHVEAEEEALLKSPARPIVLLKKRLTDDSEQIAESVAPGNPFLGVMLPYTPVHHLLFEWTQGLPLVMTSGNQSDEPIAYENDDAVARLSGIADMFLVHNRPIHIRCDDSVTRIVGGSELPIRRSRGYAPQPISLPIPCRVPTLAVGGQLKGTFALGREKYAFVSHHLGDLDHFEAFKAFERDVELYEKLFECRPAQIVHDLHPDYAATRYALGRASKENIQLIAVQHHHAHMASCMAENRLNEPVIGVSFDGTGYGLDGAIWGGEFLVGDYHGFRRAAYLRYVRMPGADTAIREPWRMALAHLLDANCDVELLGKRIPAKSLKTVRQMNHRGFNSPLTSSAGRLFDAVASLAGVRDRVSYEGQAAIELEKLAAESTVTGSYPFDMYPAPTSDAKEKDYPLTIDPRPMLQFICRELTRGASSSEVARRFHTTMVEMILQVCRRVRNNVGLDAVVLSGGVFMNVLLTNETIARLGADHFRVYRHHLVPPNDAGLSLGQLAIAAARENPVAPTAFTASE